MSSNPLASNDFNPINGVVPTSVRTATLQKDDKPQLTNNPSDKFERISQALQSQPKPTANPNSLAPWLIAGTSLLVSLGTVAMVATQFFKRPAEVPNSLSEASIKPILERLTTLEVTVSKVGSELELKDIEALLQTLKQDLQSGNKQQVDGILHQITELENRIKTHTKDSLESIQQERSAIKTKVVSPQSLLDSEVNWTLLYPDSTNNQVQYFLCNAGGATKKYQSPEKENTIQSLITERLNYLKESIPTAENFEGIRAALLVGNECENEASSSLKFSKTLELINELIYAENSDASSSIIDASTGSDQLFQAIKTNHPVLFRNIQAVITAKGQDLPAFRKAFGELVTELENIFIKK